MLVEFARLVEAMGVFKLSRDELRLCVELLSNLSLRVTGLPRALLKIDRKGICPVSSL
ncbi:hypothetical protein D3C80_1889630 [compost metagenome]